MNTRHSPNVRGAVSADGNDKPATPKTDSGLPLCYPLTPPTAPPQSPH